MIKNINGHLKNHDGNFAYEIFFYKNVHDSRASNRKTCIILYRTKLQQDYQQQNYPPPTSPNFEDTLEREEDCEGSAEAFHHVFCLSGVTSELL